MSKPKPEGPADTGEPCEEGAKVPGEDAVRRNTDGSFPGDANLPKEGETIEKTKAAEEDRARIKGQVENEAKPAPAEGRH